jgi:DNA repair photolyase
VKNKIVRLPSIKEPIHDSPGFAKKLLADADALHAVGAHAELMGLCGFGCLYCSSNTGNFLRINREPFARETEKQTGERIAPVDFEPAGDTFTADPALTFVWPDIEARLDAQLTKKGPTWGQGRMLVLSQLTDAFSPVQVADGTTERVLRALLTRTSFKIRVLTKNAAVAKPPFLPLLVQYRERVLVGLSVGTMDDGWAKAVEIGTSPPSARIRAHRALQDAGVPVYGMLCPVFPDAVFNKDEGRGLEDLLEAIRPERCEHVYFEALNDRGNWRAVASGYPEGSEWRRWIERVWGEGDKGAWSAYAAELHERVMAISRRDGWEARHLLYEDMITPNDARAFAGLDGVLLQSPTTTDKFESSASVSPKSGAGWSRNPSMRSFQQTPEHGHAEGWKAARIAQGLSR